MKIGGVNEHFNFPWKDYIQKHPTFEGEELEWTDMHGGTGQMIQSLENNDLDACILLAEGLTKSILNGSDLEMIDIWVASSLQWGIHANSNLVLNNILSLPEIRFAVSRMNSGSHLMAFEFAKQHEYNGSLSFVVGNDLNGCVELIKSRQADIFLWEKFTTRPYVTKGDLSYWGDTPTPWPAFVLASRRENSSRAKKIIYEVRSHTQQLIKKESQLLLDIAQKHGLATSEIESWYKELEWQIEPGNVRPVLDQCTAFLENIKS